MIHMVNLLKMVPSCGEFQSVQNLGGICASILLSTETV